MEENNNMTENMQLEVEESRNVFRETEETSEYYYHPKKNKMGIVIAVIIALVAFLMFISSILSTTLNRKKGAEEMMKEGIENIEMEMLAYTTTISDQIGFGAIAALKDGQSIHTNLDASLTLPDINTSDMGIGIDAVTNLNNRQGTYNIRADLSGKNLSVADITVDDSDIYLSSPLISDDVYSFNTTSLADDYNNSVWRELNNNDMKMPEKYNFELFGFLETESINDLRLQFNEDVAKRFSVFKGTAQYDLLKDKKSFEINGKTVECSGILITFAKSDVNTFINGIKEDFMSSDYYNEIVRLAEKYIEDYDKADIDELIYSFPEVRFGEDLVVRVYFDDEGRIVEIKSDAAKLFDGYPDIVEFTADFGGDERTLDEIEANLCFTSGGENLGINFIRKADVTIEEYNEDIRFEIYQNNSYKLAELDYWNDWIYDDNSFNKGYSISDDSSELMLTAKGRFNNIRRGECYTLDFDNVFLSMDGENKAVIKGSVTNEIFDGEIEIPENSVNIFEMTEDDIYKIVYGVIMSEYLYK